MRARTACTISAITFQLRSGGQAAGLQPRAVQQVAHQMVQMVGLLLDRFQQIAASLGVPLDLASAQARNRRLDRRQRRAQLMRHRRQQRRLEGIALLENPGPALGLCQPGSIEGKGHLAGDGAEQTLLRRSQSATRSPQRNLAQQSMRALDRDGHPGRAGGRDGAGGQGFAHHPPAGFDTQPEFQVVRPTGNLHLVRHDLGDGHQDPSRPSAPRSVHTTGWPRARARWPGPGCAACGRPTGWSRRRQSGRRPGPRHCRHEGRAGCSTEARTGN